MSAILLFCTAKVPGNVINRLMEECALPEMASNFFSLVRTPDQPTLDEWQTDPPVQDFDTGFEGKSDAELRQFCSERIQRHKSESETPTSLTDKWFAVLDDKSAAQSAVTIHFSYQKDIWGPTPIPGRPEIVNRTLWWKFRVPFDSAYTLWNATDSVVNEAIELYSRPEHLDSDGVIQTEIPEMILAGEMKDPKGLV